MLCSTGYPNTPNIRVPPFTRGAVTARRSALGLASLVAESSGITAFGLARAASGPASRCGLPPPDEKCKLYPFLTRMAALAQVPALPKEAQQEDFRRPVNQARVNELALRH